jgi:hypothetical protein
MRDKEILGLHDAYLQVHSHQEEVEQLDELSLDTLRSARKERFKKVDEIESSGKEDPEGRKKLRRTQKAIAKKTAPGQPDYPHKGASARLNMEMEYDAFDVILEHLIAEGYADTEEAATVIMANMSEEWRQSIVEQSAIGARAAKVVGDQRQGYHGDSDAINKLQDAASSSMGRLKKGQGPVVTPGLPGV